MHLCRPIRQNAWIRGVLGDVKPIQELPEFLDQSESSTPPLPSSLWNFFSGTRWSKKKEKFTERIRPIICSKSGTVYVWKFRPSWLCGRRGDDERKWGCWGSEKEQSCQGDQKMFLYLLICICVLLRRNSLAKVTQIKKNAAALTKKTKEKIPRQPAWGRFSKTSSKVLFFTEMRSKKCWQVLLWFFSLIFFWLRLSSLLLGWGGENPAVVFHMTRRFKTQWTSFIKCEKNCNHQVHCNRMPPPKKRRRRHKDKSFE